MPLYQPRKKVRGEKRGNGILSYFGKCDKPTYNPPRIHHHQARQARQSNSLALCIDSYGPKNTPNDLLSASGTVIIGEACGEGKKKIGGVTAREIFGV